jgi:CubicO group peptidase (beta-lactamase class C family)
MRHLLCFALALATGCANLLAQAAPASDSPPSPHSPPSPATPAVPPKRPGPVEPLDQAAIARIDRGLTRAAQQQKFWGAVLVAQSGKPLIARGFGTRFPGATPGQPGSDPITSSTIFEIASISKPFTAIAILQLVEQGKLSLSDPIEKYLSAIKSLPDKPSGLTLRHLLSHTTGRDNDDAMPSYDEPNRNKMVRDFLRSKRLTEPGERFDYNNHAYCVLAAIIELTAGKPFEQHMKEAIFTPAGMTSTSFIGDDALRPRAARRLDDLTQVNHPWGWGYKGCGGIVTCLDDLLAFDTALREHRLLSPASMELMHQNVTQVIRPSRPGRPAPANQPTEFMSLGWFKSELATVQGLAPRTRFNHTGSSTGTVASLTRFPQEQILIVVLSGDRSTISPLSAGLEWAVMREAAPRTRQPR